MTGKVIRVDDNNDDASMHDAKSLAAVPRYARESFRSSAIASGLPSTISTSTFGARVPQATNRLPNHRFIPRPFPPPALANVPVEYIVDQLHSLASNYWSKPETADCTIIVPLPTVNSPGNEQVSRPCSNSPEPLFEPVSGPKNSRKAALKSPPSTPRPAPRMVMKLHIDYLSAQSKLLRGIFSGTSPTDITSRTPSGCCTPMPSMSQASRNFNSGPASRSHPFSGTPRFLPSASPTQPVLFLSVPDPSSFRILVHYMYFGSTVYLEDALDSGEISWEGLARNVEYLGMSVEIKVFLGRWYGRWKRGRDYLNQDEEYDSDDSYDTSDAEDLEFFERQSSTTSTSFTMDSDDEMTLEEDFRKACLDSEPTTRGRKRDSRRLGHATSDPTLQASIPHQQSFHLPPSPRALPIFLLFTSFLYPCIRTVLSPLHNSCWTSPFPSNLSDIFALLFAFTIIRQSSHTCTTDCFLHLACLEPQKPRTLADPFSFASQLINVPIIMGPLAEACTLVFVRNTDVLFCILSDRRRQSSSRLVICTVYPPTLFHSVSSSLMDITVVPSIQTGKYSDWNCETIPIKHRTWLLSSSVGD